MRNRRGQAVLRIVRGAVLLVAAAAHSAAATTPCDDAAVAAARETGVSLALLRAIMLAESGTDRGAGRQAWPWTVQSQGQGHWLDTREQAVALAQGLIDAGETNVDIGCFQINVRWHSGAFPSLEAMIDPMANARYAAQYLTELHARTGDWRSAAGAYHSRDAARAEGYVERLVALHNESAAAPPAAADPAQPPEIVRNAPGGPIIVLGSLAGPLIGGLP